MYLLTKKIYDDNKTASLKCFENLLNSCYIFGLGLMKLSMLWCFNVNTILLTTYLNLLLKLN